jgi:hypothetical protein
MRLKTIPTKKPLMAGKMIAFTPAIVALLLETEDTSMKERLLDRFDTPYPAQWYLEPLRVRRFSALDQILIKVGERPYPML